VHHFDVIGKDRSAAMPSRLAVLVGFNRHGQAGTMPALPLKMNHGAIEP
jgi:hypothetical protein